MPQPTITAVRTALAAQLTAKITGLRATANRAEVANPPAALVIPEVGTLIRYGGTFDGTADLFLRIILVVSRADSTAGQDIIDPYVSPSGASSINAALEADPSLGGTVHWCHLIEATGYGQIDINGVTYLGCHLIVTLGI